MSCTLVPINLTNPSEYEKLRHQRTVCGWSNTADVFENWRKKQEAGLKSFFWIMVPCGESKNESTVSDTTPVRVGHISLDAYADPPDYDLANEKKTNLTIQQFFILPQYRSGGLGRTVMKMIEDMATKKPYGSPDCEYITLNTMSKKHYYDDVTGPYIRSVMAICNQEWYERQGYVSWKEEPRYEDTLPDKTQVVFDAVFMRKRVNRNS
ncbi:hypothetical protein BJX61DRAFT_124590 [Aspergillus egyptiacus]|nr:hypothetical protein BJX61DRAFT_124590 [Aspergillus egyptiacus]